MSRTITGRRVLLVLIVGLLSGLLLIPSNLNTSAAGKDVRPVTKPWPAALQVSFGLGEDRLKAALRPQKLCTSWALVERRTNRCKVRALTRAEVKTRWVRDAEKKNLTRLNLGAGVFTPASFKAGSFNILGSGHTDGSKANRKTFKHSSERTPKAFQYVVNQGLSLVGFQEFQEPQYKIFKARMPAWRAYPGLEAQPHAIHNSIGWDDRVWERLDAFTTPIPYFGGKPFPMPTVLLKHRASNRLMWVSNYHNPANARGNAAKYRAAAVRIEAALAMKLEKPGVPVMVLGDMNDREAFICPFLSATEGYSSSTGASRASGSCVLGSPVAVDWMVGSSALSFTNSAVDFTPKDARWSDHPLVRATVNMAAPLDRSTCMSKSFQGERLTYCPKRKVKALARSLG